LQCHRCQPGGDRGGIRGDGCGASTDGAAGQALSRGARAEPTASGRRTLSRREEVMETRMNQPPVRVAVIGYGVIGKRVADAVALQQDMQLAGVADVAIDWRLKVAAALELPIFA